MTHIPGWGASLKWDAAGGTVFVAIGQVRDIQVASISRDSIDVTDHDSKATTSGFREFVAGPSDGGELSFTVALDTTDATQIGAAGTGLLGSFSQDGCTVPAWQCTLNVCTGTAIWTFDGFPTGFTPNVPVADVMTADIAVKITGRPVLTVT